MAKKPDFIYGALIACLFSLLLSCSMPPPYLSTVPQEYRNTVFFNKVLSVFPLARETFTFTDTSFKRYFDSLDGASSGRFVDSLNRVVAECVRMNCAKINVAAVQPAGEGVDVRLTTTIDGSTASGVKEKLILPEVDRVREIAPEADIVLFVYRIEVSGDRYNSNKTPVINARYLFFDYPLNRVVGEGEAHYPATRPLLPDKNNPNTTAGWCVWIDKLLVEVLKPSPFMTRTTVLYFPVAATITDDRRVKLVGTTSEYSSSSLMKVSRKKGVDSAWLPTGVSIKMKEYVRSSVTRSLDTLCKRLGPHIHNSLNLASKPKLSSETWATITGSMTYQCQQGTDSSITWYRVIPAGIPDTGLVQFIDACLGAKAVKRSEAPALDSLTFILPLFLDCMPQEASGGYYYHDPFMQQRMMTPPPPMPRF